MRYLVVFLIFAIFLTPIFGFFFMNHEMGVDGMGVCPLVAFLTLTCSSDAIPMVAQHISAFLSFSNNPLTPFFSLLIILAITALIWVQFRSRYFQLATLDITNRYHLWDFSIIQLPSTKKFFNWLSLLENSPSSI